MNNSCDRCDGQIVIERRTITEWDLCGSCTPLSTVEWDDLCTEMAARSIPPHTPLRFLSDGDAAGPYRANDDDRHADDWDALLDSTTWLVNDERDHEGELDESWAYEHRRVS